MRREAEMFIPERRREVVRPRIAEVRILGSILL